MVSKVLSAIVAVCLLMLCACRQETSTGEKEYLPQFHFSAGSEWTGEPSGLVYDNGEYHLFYQYNPADAMYGNIHWGHAVSRDLVQWQIVPVALSPDSLGYLKSGSVVVDKDNTSGLGSGESAPFIAFYTYQTSSGLANNVVMAYSLDKGQTWTKWDKPLLSGNDEQALQYPHVSWSEEFGKWIMTVSQGSSVRFYTSPDCKQWEFKSDFQYFKTDGVLWEGTDFFSLQVEGSHLNKWVLLVNMENGPAGGSPATRYFIGDFDGTTFSVTQTKELWLDYGKDNYAGSTFNNCPEGNRIWLGWMNCWEYANLLPTTGWRGSMTFPRNLTLVKEGKHYVLASVPVSSLKEFCKEEYSIKPVKLSDEKRMKASFPYPGKSFIIQLKFDNKDNMAIWRAGEYGISLMTKSGKKLSIGYQNELSYYYIDREGLEKETFSDTFGQLMGATYRSEAPITDWYILFDRNSIELFADGGRTAMTTLCYPDEEFSSFEIYAKSGSINLLDASIVELERKNEL